MSATGMNALRKTTLNIYNDNKIGRNFNVSMEDFVKLRQQYVNGIGRNVGVGSKGLSDLAAMSRILGDEGAVEFGSKLENFGLSLAESGDKAGKLFAKASKFGISAEKMSKNFLTNISKAQDYSFARGIKGLENMAKRATELKLDMGQAFAFADKVNTVEGAISTAASLQVLGGPFTQYSDAIQMLQEGLTDPEALQERMIKMFGSMAYYDQKKGQMDMSAFNRQRVRAAAQAAGLDYSNVMEMVFSKGRGDEIAKQARGNGIFANNEGFMNLLKNVGTIENGVAGAYLTRNGQQEFVKAQDITKDDISELVAKTRSESDNIQEIAKTLRGWDDVITGGKKQREAAKAQIVETKGIGQRVQNLVDMVSSNNFLLKTIAIASVYGGIMGTFGGGALMLRGAARMRPGIANLFRRTASSRIVGGGGIGGSIGGRSLATSRAMRAARTGGSNFVNVNGATIGARSGRSMDEMRRIVALRNGDTFFKTGSGQVIATESGLPMKTLREMGSTGRGAGRLGGRAVGRVGGRLASGAGGAIGGAIGGGILSGLFTAFEEFGTENNHSKERK